MYSDGHLRPWLNGFGWHTGKVGMSSNLGISRGLTTTIFYQTMVEVQLQPVIWRPKNFSREKNMSVLYFRVYFLTKVSRMKFTI